MKYVILALIVLGFAFAIVYNPGKESWENVGPRWACLINPEKYDFCIERE